MLIAFLIAWGIMSAVTFFVYAHDKLQAKKGKWRVKEKTLLLLAFLMGAPGALAAMVLMRHKTLKRKFTIPVPAFCILQTAVLILLI